MSPWLLRTSAVLLTAGLAGCATAPVIRVDQGGPQAHLVALENQLHEDSRRLQERLAHEGALYEDPALTAHLQELGRKLAPADLRAGTLEYDFRIIRDPTVNAIAFPNAKTYYHLGLLAHTRNPDMLAAVMAHEVSHALHRDMVYFRDDFRQKTVAAKIAQLTLVPGAALFGFGDLANLLLNVSYAASVTGYGRDKEARADRYAMERLREAGMNPAAVTEVFDVFLKEEERFDRGLEIWFLMSHPTTRQRLADAKEWLATQGLSAAGLPRDDPEFLALSDPARIEAVRLNIGFERYFHASDILEDVLSRQPEDPTALCLQAECYRLLAENPKTAERELSSKAWAEIRPKSRKDWESDWQRKAEEAFTSILARHPDLPEAHRGLGLLHAARAKKLLAIRHLESYLSLRPNAADRRLVTSRLEALRQPEDSESAQPRR